MAVDEGSGEVVGMAVWEVFGGEGGGGFDGVGEEKGGLKAEGEGGKGKGRLGEGPWDSEEEKGFAEGLYGELLRQREGFLRGRGGRGVGMFDFFFFCFFKPLSFSSSFSSSSSGDEKDGGCCGGYRIFFYLLSCSFFHYLG